MITAMACVSNSAQDTLQALVFFWSAVALGLMVYLLTGGDF